VLVHNRSIYNYYLKNNTISLAAGAALTVSDNTWETDDQLARTIETLDHAGYIVVTSPPVGYPRTLAFPDIVNIIGIEPPVTQIIPLTTPNLQDVIDALVALGLVEQSD
jgi:hypothetical protein